MIESTLELEDGKYKIIQKNNTIKALRHGEEWRDLTEDNLFYFLLSMNQDLECHIGDLKKQNVKLIKIAPKLYAEIESEIEFLKELREDSHSEYQITLLDEKIEQKQNLLAEARGE